MVYGTRSLPINLHDAFHAGILIVFQVLSCGVVWIAECTVFSSVEGIGQLGTLRGVPFANHDGSSWRLKDRVS